MKDWDLYCLFLSYKDAKGKKVKVFKICFPSQNPVVPCPKQISRLLPFQIDSWLLTLWGWKCKYARGNSKLRKTTHGLNSSLSYICGTSEQNLALYVLPKARQKYVPLTCFFNIYPTTPWFNSTGVKLWAWEPQATWGRLEIVKSEKVLVSGSQRSAANLCDQWNSQS